VTRAEPVLHMAGPVPPTIETPLSIVEVQTSAQLSEIMAKVFPDGWTDDFAAGMRRTAVTMPGTAELWGLLDGRLVAGAIVMVTSSIAGIYAVSVEEEFRRRGYGTAITWAAIDAGLRLGAKSVWLGSTEMALPMYLNRDSDKSANIRCSPARNREKRAAPTIREQFAHTIAAHRPFTKKVQAGLPRCSSRPR
jgi:GNAT superfamily N-acetyltransferase